MTVYTRELFFPETRKGRESVILNLLHGVNEIHHTLANYPLRWGGNEKDWPPQVLSQKLSQIANHYRIAGPIEFSDRICADRDRTPRHEAGR